MNWIQYFWQAEFWIFDWNTMEIEFKTCLWFHWCKFGSWKFLQISKTCVSQRLGAMFFLDYWKFVCLKRGLKIKCRVLTKKVPQVLSHCTNVSMQLQVQCHDHIIGKAPTAALWASSANNVKKPFLSKILKFWFTKMPKLLLKTIIGITIIIHICDNYIGFKVCLHFWQSWPTVRRCKDPGTTTWKWKQVSFTAAATSLLPFHSKSNSLM